MLRYSLEKSENTIETFQTKNDVRLFSHVYIDKKIFEKNKNPFFFLINEMNVISC